MAKEGEKGLREVNAEIKALKKKLLTLDKKTGEYARTKSKINTLEIVAKRLKTPAREALLAGAKDAKVVSETATEAPKMGTGKKGRPAKEVKFGPIIDPKTGRVRIGQARYMAKKGIITSGELAQYEKLALTRNAKFLPEAERGPKVTAEDFKRTGGRNAPRGVTVTGPEDKPKGRVAKTPKPKDDAAAKPKNAPKNKANALVERPKDYYKPVADTPRARLDAAKRAYDDGKMTRSEFDQAKKRFMSENRAIARKTGTTVPRGKRPAQLTKAAEAAANARDRAADQRDLANARDRAADVKDLQKYGDGRRTTKAPTAKELAAGKAKLRAAELKPVLKKRSEEAAKKSAKELRAARAERLGAKAPSKATEALRPLMKVLKNPAIRTALRTTGKVAGPAAAVIGAVDTAITLQTKEGLTSAMAARKAVMDATEGKYRDTSNMFSTAALAQAKAAAKAAANRAQGVKPADMGSSGKNTRKPTVGLRASDRGDSSRTPKPMSSGRQNRPTGRLGASGGRLTAPGTYTVKSGDNLWKIAQKNNTTVTSLLKANPTIAKRREAGKVDIYSGSKVRIPGKK